MKPGLEWFNTSDSGLHSWGSSLRRRYRAPLGGHMFLCCFCSCCPPLGWSQVMHFSRGGADAYKTPTFPSLQNQKVVSSLSSPPFPPSVQGSLYLPGRWSHFSPPTPSPSGCWEPDTACSMGTEGTWDDPSPPCSSLGSASVFLSVLILVLLQK